MNIGIRLHDTAGSTLEEHLSNAHAQGFSCIHLALQKVIPGFSIRKAPELLTDELAAEVRTLLQKYGMTCAVLGCYLNLATPDEADYQALVRIYQAHLDFAKKIGALCVGTETGCPNPEYKSVPECRSEEALALFIRRIAPIVRCAEEIGVNFAIEPVAKHIVCTPERAARVLAAYPDCPHLRIIFDAVNLLDADNCGRADAVVADGLGRLSGAILLLHLKDWVRDGDALKSVACGLGNMRYEVLVGYARQHDLPITLENTKPDNAKAARMLLEGCGA